MSRNASFKFCVEREGRVTQMTKQEEVIARKRQDLLEKQKTNELAKQVVAAQYSASSSATTKSTKEKKHSFALHKQTLVNEPPLPKNNFNNDGSFLENFKKITEAVAMKAEEEEEEEEEKKLKRQKVEAERKAKEEMKQAENAVECQFDGPEYAENLNRGFFVRNAPPFSTISMSASATPNANASHTLPPVHGHNIPSLLSLPIQVATAATPPSPQASLIMNDNSFQVGSVMMMPPPPILPPFLGLVERQQLQQIQHPNDLSTPNQMSAPRDPDLMMIPGPQMNDEIINIPDMSNLHQMPPAKGNNYLNEKHDHSLNNRGNKSDQMTRTIVNTTTNLINFNQNPINYRNHDSSDALQPQQLQHCLDPKLQQLSSSLQAINQHVQQSNRNETRGTSSMSSSFASTETTTTTTVSKTLTTIPTTIDDLIEYIAKNGDHCETKILSEIAQMNERTLFRFLNFKGSVNYQTYREKVTKYRLDHLKQSQPLHSKRSADGDNDKYDPEDILQDKDDDDDENNEQKQLKQSAISIVSNSMQSNDYGDEYDSDSEYMHEAKERNLKNMKRRIDSGGASGVNENNDDDDDDRTDDENNIDKHTEMLKRIQMLERALHQSDDAVQYQQLPDHGHQQQQAQQQSTVKSTTAFVSCGNNQGNSTNRNKRSRWGDKVPDDGSYNKPTATTQPPALMSLNISQQSTSSSLAKISVAPPMLTTITRNDPALLMYARQNYGTANLNEDEWKMCEDHYKVNLLYQNMLKKREEIDRLARSGKFKYEYDSDEDIAGGTWEHKLRNAEMEATAVWAEALNQQSEGKHHIGDFLPPEELKKFMDTYNARQMNREPDLSDYKEYKLQENNKGFQMLQKLGWNAGEGLGVDGAGIVDPLNKAPHRDNNQGLGVAAAAVPVAGDNEYDAYRKRMMLAYRFRPNPLNNPRRAYY